MMASTFCRGLSLPCLFALTLLISFVGAMEDGGVQRTSFAGFGHPSLRHRDRRRAEEKARMPRQAAGAMTYTPDETQALLNAHTEYRRNVTPPAADMNAITWNTELADLARGWAERCVFEHGFPSEPQAFGGVVAQNLWMGSKSYALTSAVTAWYNEYKDYDYATEACSAECGHYRIMVLSGLEAIGCGSAICDNGRQTLTVCNYGPSVPGRGQPYKAGPACALCASGTGWCDRKLCRTDCPGGDQCECNLKCQNCGQLDSALCQCDCKAGWRGTDCSEPCADYEAYCSSGAYTPEACRPDPGAQKDCPATCKLCEAVTDSTAAEDKCCDGKECDEGEVLNETSCECVDYLEKTKTEGGGGGGGGGVAPVTVSWTCVIILPALVTSLRMLIG